MRHLPFVVASSLVFAGCAAAPAGTLAGGMAGSPAMSAWMLEQCRADYSACQPVAGYATPDDCWAAARQVAAPEGYIRNCRTNNG